MARRCTVCAHEARDAIDLAIVSGDSFRSIACTHGMSRMSVARHAENHVSEALRAVVVEERGRDLVGRLEGLMDRVESVIASAEAEGKAGQLLSAVREMRGLLETWGRATGELRDQPQVAVVNLATDPQWIALRQAMVEVARRHGILDEVVAELPEAT